MSRRYKFGGLLVVMVGLTVFSGSAVGSSARTQVSPAKVAITAGAAAPFVQLGSRVAVTGKITPGLAGVAIALQNYIGSRWLVDQVTRTRANGAFTFQAQPRLHGVTHWRVVTARNAKVTGVSRVVDIRALAWTFLNTLPAVGVDGGWSGDPQDADGVHYAHPESVTADCYASDGGVNWREWDLGRSYREFEGTVSIRDDAPDGSGAEFAVIVDGQTLSSGSVKLGSSMHFDVNVAKGLRLRLQETNPLAGEQGCTQPVMVFGDVQLLG